MPWQDLYESQHKFGRNSDIDTAAAEDIWDGGGTYAWPSAAATTTIVSDSVADDGDPAGTGARTVTVYGLNSAGLMISETVTLNGTGAVTLANSYLRVYRARVATAGSGGTNAGNIQIKHGSTVLAQITADMGQTLMAIYTVPADYQSAWLARWQITVAKNVSTVAVVALQMRSTGGAWQTKDIVSISNAVGAHTVDYPAWRQVAALTDIRVRAISVSANDTDITSAFTLLLER